MSDNLRDEPSIERVADLYSWAYAWRSRDGDDDTDLSSVRKRNRAEFERALEVEVARRVADAWDEGQKSGMRHAARMRAAYEMGRPELPGPPSPNPYRAASIETGDNDD